MSPAAFSLTTNFSGIPEKVLEKQYKALIILTHKLYVAKPRRGGAVNCLSPPIVSDSQDDGEGRRRKKIPERRPRRRKKMKQDPGKE